MSSKLQLDVLFATSISGPFGKRLRGKDASLAESNGSLPPGGDLKSHLSVLRDQHWAQRSVTSMGELYL